MKRALLFAHYDKQGLVDPHVLHYLKSLRPLVKKIVFVSAGGKESEMRNLEGLCDYAVCKSNEGYDFMSWKLGLQHLPEAHQYDELIFANDSVYAPLFNILPFFKKSESFNADFWGATRSWETEPHIQSFFLAFRQRLVKSTVFDEFWESVSILPDKKKVITNYEIGLSSRIRSAGFRSDALFDPLQLSFFTRIMAQRQNDSSKKYRASHRLNPMHHYWNSVLAAGIPMIKVELLRDNPTKININKVKRYLEGFPVHYELISEHLRRVYAVNNALEAR